MSTILSVKNLSVKIANDIILDNINFDVQKQDFIIFTGPNGGGKSTICNLISNLTSLKCSGKVEITKGMKLTHAPQKLNPPKSLPISVRNFFEYSGGVEDIEPCVNKFFTISDLLDKKLDSLSGGQLQKINLCNAIRQSSDLIILDEPDQNLDFKSQESLYKILIELKRIKKTVIVVSHDIHRLSKDFNDTKVFCINKTIHCGDSIKQVHDQHCIVHD